MRVHDSIPIITGHVDNKPTHIKEQLNEQTKLD